MEAKRLPFVLKRCLGFQTETSRWDRLLLFSLLVCQSRKFMFLSHPNSALSPKSPWIFGPQTTHEYTKLSAEPAPCRAAGCASKNLPWDVCCFNWIQTLPRPSICPVNRPDCSSPWDILWCLYEKYATPLNLLLKDVIFTLQNSTDCMWWLHSVSRSNNNYGNAEAKALAVFYSFHRSRHHVLKHDCSWALGWVFRLREPRADVTRPQQECWAARETERPWHVPSSGGNLQKAPFVQFPLTAQIIFLTLKTQVKVSHQVGCSLPTSSGSYSSHWTQSLRAVILFSSLFLSSLFKNVCLSSLWFQGIHRPQHIHST